MAAAKPRGGDVEAARALSLGQWQARLSLGYLVCFMGQDLLQHVVLGHGILGRV